MLNTPSQVSDRELQSEQLSLSIPPYLDANADLSSPHHPETQGKTWFAYTQEHFMIELKLTPCARLLYHYVLLKAPGGCFLEIDLHDFQRITAEHRRGKPYSMRQIRNAVSELEKLQLVVIKSERFKMLARHPGKVANNRPSSKEKLTSTSGKLTSTSGKLTSTSEKLISKSSPETPVEQGFPPPTDLYRSNQITHTAAPADATSAPHPGVCDFFVEEEEGNSAATKTHRKNRLKLSLPGTPEEEAEFLEWKGERLVEAGQCTKEEARGFALSWAKKNAEEATLQFEDWHAAQNQQLVSATSSPPVTIPNFAHQSKSWHEELITAYRQLGEETFLAQQTWHKDWLYYARNSYMSEKLEG